MNLQPLRQNEQDMYMVRPDKVLAWRGGGGHQLPSLVKGFSAIASCWNLERVSFVKGVAPGGLTVL